MFAAQVPVRAKQRHRAEHGSDILLPNKEVFDLKCSMTSMPIIHTDDYKTTTSKMLPA